MGKVRSGGITDTDINFTGQRLDATGLLYPERRESGRGGTRWLASSAPSAVPLFLVQPLGSAISNTGDISQAVATHADGAGLPVEFAIVVSMWAYDVIV